ncbi:MinD/ParA family protein [Gryllotalpicola reticulitermitis]|uniref:MinD/ParA family protein n=1 Tax=Gryllotalpicola reticulitermitis TaxID=1184153 RepID=A0ABV8QDK0_9MICO
MSDPNTENSRGIFDDASRADEFVEDDTMIVQRTRRSAQQPQDSEQLEVPEPVRHDGTAAPAAQQAAEQVRSAFERPAPQQPPTSWGMAPAAPPAAQPQQQVEQPLAEQPPAEAQDQPAQAAPAPDFSALFTGQRPAQSAVAGQKASKGFRGFLARTGMNVKPGAAEAAELEHRAKLSIFETQIRQATWSRAVSVLVANPKGGTGKTPAALLLGGTIASIRGGQVAIVEVSDDPGALTYRAEGNPQVGLGELVRDLDRITNAGQLAGYTAPQSSFAAVIGTVGRRPRLTGDAVIGVAGLVDEFYGIRVMDSGNQPTSEAFRAAVQVADALVIPVMNAGDSTVEALRLLEELRADGGHAAELAANAIGIRLVDGRHEDPTIAAEVEQVLAREGIRSLHTIPFDPHIAERVQITLGQLAPATREAFITAAASVVRSLQASVTISKRS